MSSKKIKQKSTLSIKFLGSLIIIGIFIIGLYSFRLIFKPAAINLIGSPEKNVSTIGTGVVTSKIAPIGCRYMEVQCIKAPCDPVLVCDQASIPPKFSPLPIPSTTSNMTPPANCISWFDGCNTCSVKNGVIGGCTMMACKLATQPPSCLSYIDTAPSPTPTPSATSVPSPVIIAKTVGVTMFSVSGACGSTSFNSISYSCNNNKMLITLSSGTCTDFSLALKKAQLDCNSTGVATP